MLELSDKNFKGKIVDMLRQGITNMLQTNEKIKQSQQRNRRNKEEPNRNFGTEKYNNQNQPQKDDSTAEWT